MESPLNSPPLSVCQTRVAQRDAVAMQMLLDARGEHRTGRRAAYLCERPEQQTTTNFPCGVLHDRQLQALRLPPVARDIV
jgi:hypothetical protein